MVANVQDALDVGDRNDREPSGRMRYDVLTRRVVGSLKFRRRGLSETRFNLTLIHYGLAILTYRDFDFYFSGADRIV